MQVFDVETGFDTVVLNMNPDGWIPGVTNERTWIMLYGLDVCTERQLIIAGDNKGKVYFADARTNKEIAQLQLHKKGNKVRQYVSAMVLLLPALRKKLSVMHALVGNSNLSEKEPTILTQ